jgi:hypothetical protein
MSGIINDKESVLRIILGDNIGDLHGKGELCVIGGNGKDFGFIVVAFPQTLFQIVQLWYHP